MKKLIFICALLVSFNSFAKYNRCIWNTSMKARGVYKCVIYKGNKIVKEYKKRWVDGHNGSDCDYVNCSRDDGDTDLFCVNLKTGIIGDCHYPMIIQNYSEEPYPYKTLD